ncbi:MAG: hypothetical protein KAU20_07850 [Nanoarchaeota archaeon]|nr:hypothetical protein [Nanoarchaeota archaeon]
MIFDGLLLSLGDIFSCLDLPNPFNAASIQGNPNDIIRPQLTPAGSIYQNIFFKKHLRPISWRRIKKNGKNKE